MHFRWGVLMPHYDIYAGLLAGRPAVILATRDGDYSEHGPMNGLDFHLPYLTKIMELMGLGPIHSVVAEGLWDAQLREKAVARSVQKCRDLAEIVCSQFKSASQFRAG